MKVSIPWLKELVNLNISDNELINLLPLRSVSLKEIKDDSLELDMKGYNRADLLSMRGVAYEVAAITDSPLKFREKESTSQFIFGDKQIPSIGVSVENNHSCPFYCLVKIEDLKVEPSPQKWIKKLEDCGIRSINNVADITNLMMLEYGQPMHAFDGDKVSGSVRVRVAKSGEQITTLDGKTRNLNQEDLLIADEKGPIGIAGVMGGKDSEVTDFTTSILLEAAIFDPVSIRRTAQRHGLPSEASKRFQHGLTKKRLLQALDEAVRTYMEYGGRMTGFVMVGQPDEPTKTLKLTKHKVNSLIGVDIPPKQVESSLQKLGFKLASHIVSGNTVWEVTVPYWRLDIEIGEDLVEEVARMFGYEKIPSRELEGKIPEEIDQSLPNFIYDLKKILAGLGLTEVQTYSFYSTQVISNFEFKTLDFIKVANPISSETEYLRDELWPNLVEVVAKNIKNGFKDVAIFEIGKVYSPPDKETYRLAIALMNESDNPIQELYVILNAVKNLLRLQGKLKDKKYFHPIRFSTQLAEVHPRFVNKFGIEQRIAVLEVAIEPLI